MQLHTLHHAHEGADLCRKFHCSQTALNTKQQCHRVRVACLRPSPQLNEAVVLFICSMALMLSYQQVVRVFRLAGSKQVRATPRLACRAASQGPLHRDSAFCGPAAGPCRQAGSVAWGIANDIGRSG